MNQLNSQLMRSKMKIMPALQGPYQKVVLAGQKIMYSPEMATHIQQLLATQDPLGKKIGDGAVALVGILIDQSNHTMPPQLIIPAGIEFCTDFADLLRQSKMQVSDQDVGLGMETYVAAIMQKFNMTPAKIAAAAKGQPQQPQGLVQGAQQAPPQQAAPQPDSTSVAGAEGN